MEAGRVSMVVKKRWNRSREGLNGGKEEVEWKQGRSQWWKRRGGMEAGRVSMMEK
jgi:hypothetical protein